jgi:hypothetical protein
VERNQIETVLGVAALVALADHDTIEAPTSCGLARNQGNPILAGVERAV